MGKELEEIIGPIGLTLNRFDELCEKFTNKALFKVNESGQLIRDAEKRLAKINYDNLD